MAGPSREARRLTSGVAAAVLEVHLLEPFAGDLLRALVGGALLLGVEEAGGVLRRQCDRQVPDAVSSVVPIGAV